MKHATLSLILVCLFLSLRSQEAPYDKVYFANSQMLGSYFYSDLSYTSPSWIRNINGKIPVCDSLFFTPGNSLQLNYVSAKNGTWQAKLISKPIRGMDHFTPATKLEMRILVKDGTTAGQLPQIGLCMMKTNAVNFVSIKDYIATFVTNQWIKVSIPLKDLKDIQGREINDFNVIHFKQLGNDGSEHILFIDQAELVNDEKTTVSTIPQIVSAAGYEKHVDITWKPLTDEAIKYIKIYRSADGRAFNAVGIQLPSISRYTDYTDTVGKTFFYKISFLDKNYNESSLSNVASASTHAMTDNELLDMVQEANFRYYWEGAEKTSGLALENIHGRKNMIATGASGFGIMALIAGAERKFISRDQLVNRFEKITSFLERADTFHGAFPHFLDGTTGKTIAFFGKRDNGADLVETSFMMQGLLAAKQYFNKNNPQEKSIQQKIDGLWKKVEWSWFRRDTANKYLLWHWSPDQTWVINHKLTGWNETMITYVLAICSQTHGVPAAFYYSGWARQTDEAKKYRENWSETTDGSMYTNGNTYYGIPLKVGVSNGGPLFFIHYSFLGLDPHKMQDAYTDYFSNNTNIALINYRYCVENPQHHKGYSAEAWGLTASDGLWNYSADEPVAHADHGKITPTGALASFPYTPAESMAALKNYYRNYGKFAWGEYGFRDAFNLDENWCSEIFMGLNQAPVTVMIENYRSGLLWNLFMSNPEIKNGVEKIKNYSFK